MSERRSGRIVARRMPLGRSTRSGATSSRPPGCPSAEAALDFGATGWALFRSKEGGLDFTQLAFFPTKLDFERYWYSEEDQARASAAGLYQVPLLPTLHTIVGMGTLNPAGATAAAD